MDIENIALLEFLLVFTMLIAKHMSIQDFPFSSCSTGLQLATVRDKGKFIETTTEKNKKGKLKYTSTMLWCRPQTSWCKTNLFLTSRLRIGR